jgi:ADP-heptose:LPS heptosyltransferase
MNRHFKKYYFYFLARIFDSLGLYEKSVSCYAETIRFRSFFWDSQARYAKAIIKNPKKITLQIQGGIGDFLQHLPFIIKNQSIDYIVATHYRDAKIFFEALGVKVKQYYFYSNRDEHRVIREKLKKLKYTYVCPRDLFFKQSPFTSELHLKPKKHRTIGIHMGSSQLGADKALSRAFVKDLLKAFIPLHYKIILFGTREEIKPLNLAAHKNLMIPISKKIADSLSLVHQCDFFIGSDSAFKTMASMLKIPTIVLHEDSPNHFRDRVFITPYLNSKVMFVYKYKKLQGLEIKKAVQYVLTICQRQLKK